jgi:hypothetical protein
MFQGRSERPVRLLTSPPRPLSSLTFQRLAKAIEVLRDGLRTPQDVVTTAQPPFVCITVGQSWQGCRNGVSDHHSKSEGNETKLRRNPDAAGEAVKGIQFKQICRLKYSTRFTSVSRPPLWSNGQSSWLQTQRYRVRLPALADFLCSSVSATGSTQPLEEKWGTSREKSSGSGLKN